MTAGLKELNWKTVYRTGTDDLLNDFYLPALANAKRYDRAVGYFSSELLVSACEGLSNLIRANGRMRLVIGHPLDEDEYLAVQNGQDLSWAYEDLESKIMSLLEGEKGNIARYRLQLLSWLLACGALEIRFAFRKRGMYHEKIGIIEDASGDKLVFQGSANETVSAMDLYSNAESVSVYPSWVDYAYSAYGKPFEQGFDELWSGNQRDTYTVNMPSSTYEVLANKAAQKDCPNLEFEQTIAKQIYLENLALLSDRAQKPYIPAMLGDHEFVVKEHQRKALGKWKSNDYRGILKLATGSGKTITAIYGTVKILEAFGKLVFIVAVPYNELANQWVENLRLFGIFPHKCYDSKKSWYERLKLDCQSFTTGSKNFIAIVVINKTMITDQFQELIALLPPKYCLFVGDECHRHASEKSYCALPDVDMRMGLSATPFRDDDDEIESPFPNDGKARLLNYYGPIVAEYTLSDAINDDVLTPYQYHICPVHLTDEEQEQYEDLTGKISNLISMGEKGNQKSSNSEGLTALCGQRSRLLGSAQNKIIMLRQLMLNNSRYEKGHALFYCAEGSTDIDDDFSTNISKVSKLLDDCGWRVAQFTSLESSRERKSILDSFVHGGVDALVCMKVLDEGVDIPVCNTAFILASTRNPRQYVQRRGRILRKHESKGSALIFDFVVLPANGWEESGASKSLVNAEMERVNDFMMLATNKIEVYKELEEQGLGI